MTPRKTDVVRKAPVKVAARPGAKAGAKAAVKTAAGPRAPRVTASAALGTLLEIMQHSDKDAARVSAAKIILARVTAQEEQSMRKGTAKVTKPDTTNEQQKAALDAIARLLDELAAAKSAGAAGTAQLVEGSASGAADAAGD